MSILDYLEDMFTHPEKYNKFWIALASAALTVLVNLWADNELVKALVPLAGAFGVFAFPNKR